MDRELAFDTLPLESASSSISSLVTLSSPGISADSNGLFHGLGDHAENSFSIDGQPITDQQSKVFSESDSHGFRFNPWRSRSRAPTLPNLADKDKREVIKVTTRSGLGSYEPDRRA